jgi:multicomponent Na+:H+ antiporter subunit A
MYHTDVPKSELSNSLPWLRWLANGGLGWVLGLLPLALVIWFLSMLGPVTAGTALSASIPWVPSLGIDLAFRVDGLGLLFALIVSGVGVLVVVYAGGYMAGDPQIGRFYLYLFLFMGSMIGLVLADNIIALFVFWELTSITSYLLIGYKHAYASSRAAALQALLVTGSGGLAMLAGLVLISIAGGSLEISTLIAQRDVIQASPYYPAILVLVLIGCFTKSAQFPFHFWLPNAMAAPTPVSAYLHSATMVKAGVYLLARLSPMLGGTLAWHLPVALFGAITMLLGAYLAVLQVDLKRILAFTTISALGTLTMLIGIGTEIAIKGAIVFLIVHSLYKGSLFMVAGSIDHETGTRDISGLRGLLRVMPFTAVAAALAALSMSGLPPFFGFIGKEVIYEATLEAPFAIVLLTAVAVVSNALMIAAAGMVAIRPFYGQQVSTPKKPHEAPPSMWLGPVLLAVLGLLLGLFPNFLGTPLITQAVHAVAGSEEKIKLSLWHGINPMLILSIITVTAGIAAYIGRNTLTRPNPRFRDVVEHGPEHGYTRVVEDMQRLANWQTGILQSGYLRYYLMTVVITTVVLGSLGLFSNVNLGILRWDRLAAVQFHEWLLSITILLAALYMVLTHSRLAAVAALGLIGFGVATIFMLYSAPDLAMTQFAIETLSVILFVLVLYRLPFFSSISKASERIRDGVIAGAVGLFMTLMVLTATSSDMQRRLTPFFAENSYTEAQGRNVVNVILVDFRALDTLGEIAVIAIAAIGIYTMLKLSPRDDQPEPDPPPKNPLDTPEAVDNATYTKDKDIER